MEGIPTQEFQWESPQQVQGSNEIFVVDDDEIFGRFALKLLRNYGYEARHFKSALEFLTRLRHQAPTLIILDVYMSWINGMDLAKAIRKNPRLKKVPILMVTGFPSSEVRFQGFKAGADAFLEKPFGTGELMELLTALLDKNKYKSN